MRDVISLLSSILINFQSSVRHQNITGSLGRGDALGDLSNSLPIFCDSRKIAGIIVLSSSVMNEMPGEPIQRVIKALKLCLFDLVLNTTLQVGTWKSKTLQLDVELTEGGGNVLHLTSHL